MIKPAEIQIRYSDIDVMGHVNNAVYLSYFEYTRIHYFEKLLGPKWDWKRNGIILVRNEVEYIQPIVLQDKPMIEMYIGNMGNKSFTLHYEIIVNQTVCTKALSKLVCFDGQKNKSIAIPEKMKESFTLLKKHNSINENF